MERDPDISKTVANDRVVATLKNKRRKRRIQKILYKKYFLTKNYYIKLNSLLKNKAIYILHIIIVKKIYNFHFFHLSFDVQIMLNILILYRITVLHIQ